MNDRDRLAADLHAAYEHKAPIGTICFCPAKADRLIALGWTRLDTHDDGDICTGVECGNPGHGSWTFMDFPDEERLARALHSRFGCNVECRALPEGHQPAWTFAVDAAAIAKAYREDEK